MKKALGQLLLLCAQQAQAQARPRLREKFASCQVQRRLLQLHCEHWVNVHCALLLLQARGLIWYGCQGGWLLAGASAERPRSPSNNINHVTLNPASKDDEEQALSHTLGQNTKKFKILKWT